MSHFTLKIDELVKFFTARADYKAPRSIIIISSCVHLKLYLNHVDKTLRLIMLAGENILLSIKSFLEE